MKRSISLCFLIFLLLLTSCGKTPEKPEEPDKDVVIAGDSIGTLDTWIRVVYENSEPLPSLKVYNDDRLFYFDEEFLETALSLCEGKDEAKLKISYATYKGEEVYLITGMEKRADQDAGKIEIPVIKDYDTSWKDDPVKYDGDLSYTSYLQEDPLVKRTACKVFKEEYPEGVAGLWCTCKELDKENIYYYPVEKAVKGLEDEVLIHVAAEYKEYGDRILYEDSIFHTYLGSSYEKTPVPDIYMDFGGGLVENITADIEGGTVTLRTIEIKDGAFLTVYLVLDNPDYSPGKENTEAKYYYQSTTFVKLPAAAK